MFLIISYFLVFIGLLLGGGITLLIQYLNHNEPVIWLIIVMALVGAIVGWIISVLVLVFSFKYHGKKLSKNPNTLNDEYWKFMNAGSKYVLFWLNIHLRIDGTEKLDKDKNYCFYSNHQSFLDILIYDIVLKDHPRGSLYKKEHDDNPFIGPMAKALGGVAIDRKNPKSSIDALDKVVENINAGASFMIYPEGTRSKSHKMNRYHSGSFKIALKANCDLAIVAVDGDYKLTKLIPFIPTFVKVHVVDVIPHDEVLKYNSVELSNIVFDKTNQAIN